MAIQEVRVINKDGGDASVYRFEGIMVEEVQELAIKVLTDPVTERSVVNEELPRDGEQKLEIGYKPGVMNPVSDSLLLASSVIGSHPVAATSSIEYGVARNLSHAELELIGKKRASQVETVIWETPKTLRISGRVGEVLQVQIASLSEYELQSLSNMRRLFLELDEMKVIQDLFRSLHRAPTDAEVEALAQTWSDHCGHKTFKAKLIDEFGQEKAPLMTRLKRTSEKYFESVGVTSAFKDNAGGFKFYEGQVIIAKGETHNAPVAVEPFGGGNTGVGGVLRDIAGFGLGGINILTILSNCMGLPNTSIEDVLSGSLHPKYLLLENLRGQRDYGNKMGIPTHATTHHFHPDFGPKPTSLGIVVGMIPEKYSQKGVPQPGDFLVTIGGKTGKDGIHGATFSSGAMTAETSTIDATAVQIGNPITEKTAFDALIVCRDKGLIHAVTDCGAGGYSSAVGEMGEHVGVSVNLHQIPLKYEGMAPWEIWVSESQERMVVAVHPDKWDEFKRICDAYEAPATVIGQFTGDKQLHVSYKNEPVVDIPMDFLHNGLPQRELHMEHVPITENNDMPDVPVDWVSTYKQVLGHLNVASTESMLRQFDTTVQGRTVLHPFSGVYQDAPNDASVLAPIYGKPYGVVTSHAVNPLLNRYDPSRGTKWAVAMAASKLTAAGGNIHKAAMIDNFVWPKPNPKFLGDLDSSVDALCGMMDCLQIPCVSGKDSLSSTYTNGETEIHIPPVLNMTIFGKIPDIKKTVSCDIKDTGSTLILVGSPDVTNLGGSIYYQTQGIENTHVSHVNTDELSNTLDSIHNAIQTDRVKACKAVGEGGLATMLAQMCFGGDCGATVDLQALGAVRPDLALFHETAGTFLVEVENEDEATELFKNVPHVVLGKTTVEKTIRVHDRDAELFAADLYELKEAWQTPLKEVLSS